MSIPENPPYAWCLLIEGVDVAFWDNESAAASVDVSRSTTHVGLQPPRFSLGCNLLRGWLTEDSVSFSIEDVDGTLRDLFASVRDDATELTGTIEAYDDAGVAAVYGKHAGVELFGSSGERNRCPVVPDYAIGPRHIDDNESKALGYGIEQITAKPLLWAGRRVALYLFQRIDGAWQTWSEASREFWGTLTGRASYHDEQWKLPADGPASWLRKPSGYAAPDAPLDIAESEIRLEPVERFVRVEFYREKSFGTGAQVDVYGLDDELIAGNTRADVASAVSSAISTAKDASGTGTWGNGIWTASGTAPDTVTDQPNGDAGLKDSARLWLQMDGDVHPGQTEGFMTVRMHIKAWHAMGYDPVIQSGLKLTGEDGKYWLPFTEEEGGYWKAVCSTASAQAKSEGNYTQYDGNGTQRVYEPLWGIGGASSMAATGDHEIRLGYGDNEPPYCHGQWIAAPAEDPASPGSAYSFNNGGDVTDARFFAVQGVRRADGSEDEFDETWIGYMSWRSNSGRIGLDSEYSAPVVYVSNWENPAEWHVPPQNTSGATWQTDWAYIPGALTLVPLHVPGHAKAGTLDRPATVIRNLLVSSGTSEGWYTDNSYTSKAFGSDGVQQPGDNNLTGLNGNYPADKHIEDLSLNIPASMVQAPGYWDAEAEGLEDGLNACRVAWAGRANLEEVILGIMRPLGWVMTLRGGKYGVITPWTAVSPSEVEIALTIEDLGDDPDRAIDNVARQDLHAFEPLDEVEINVGRHPVSGDYAETVTLLANDRGARYRRAANKVQIDAWGIGPGLGGSWGKGLQNRWRKAFEFWGKQHHKIHGMRLAYRTDIWPGTIVTVTDSKLIAADGTSLNGALGIVTKVQADGERWTKTVDIVVFETPQNGYWVFGPGARMVSWDSGSNTAYCEQDYWEASGGGFDHRDVAAFVKQDWMTGTGGLVVEAIQYDGNSYRTAGTNTVSSVDTDANTITFTGGWSGTLYRDMDTHLIPVGFGSQTATWATGHFAPIADEDGEVSGNASDAKKWS